MPCDIIIKLKNEHKTLTKKSYELKQVVADFDDPIVKRCIDSATKEFGEIAKNIGVNIKVWE